MSLPDLDVLDPGDARPAVRAAVLEWLCLQRSHALRPVEAAARLREGRSPAALAASRPEACPTGRRLEADRRLLAQAGVKLLPLRSGSYPVRLARLSDAPPLLGVRGDPRVLSGRCVALVGARAATVYGLEMARRLASGLAATGVVVVSGLARGIDAAAHGAALDVGGRTVAFLACGPEAVYPAAHRRLAARIAEAGAVVSELPPCTPPRRAHFPLRNRLISGVSQAVVVVEARVRSGSLVTARHALDQGIEVLAVPGPVTAATSEGTNALLRDGAAPALCVEDVLRAAGIECPAQGIASHDSGVSGPAGRELTGPASRILAALERRPATRDELARVLAISPSALAVDLLALELGGHVAEDRDGRLRPVRAGRRGA